MVEVSHTLDAMRIKVYALVSLVCLPILLCGQTRLDSVRQALSVADYAMVIDLLGDQMVRDSTDIGSLNMLAQAYQAMGDYKSCKELRSVILAQDEGHVASTYSLAQIYQREQNWPKSIKYHKRLVELDSTNAVYHRLYAEQLVRVKEVIPAMIHSSRAYELAPNDVNVILLQAKLFQAVDSLDLADTILSRSALKFEDNIALQKEWARVKYKQDSFVQVVEILEKTKRNVDLDPPYLKMLGFSYYEIDSIDLCIDALRRLVTKLDEEFVHYYLAKAYAKKEDFEFANYHYKKAIEHGTSDNMGSYYLEKARLLELNSDQPEAIDLYKRGFAHLDDARLLIQLARISDEYYRDKNIALRYYQKYLKHEKANPLLIENVKDRINYLKQEIHQRAGG